MNQSNFLTENQGLQARSIELRTKLEVGEKALVWFESHPGGSVEDARREQEAMSAELQQIESKRSALLQQILSAPFGGE